MIRRNHLVFIVVIFISFLSCNSKNDIQTIYGVWASNSIHGYQEIVFLEDGSNFCFFYGTPVIERSYYLNKDTIFFLETEKYKDTKAFYKFTNKNTLKFKYIVDNSYFDSDSQIFKRVQRENKESEESIHSYYSEYINRGNLPAPPSIRQP